MSAGSDALRQRHESHGVRWSAADPSGSPVPRNYGDPAAEYAAARSGAVIVDRSDRALLRVHGRDPVRMIQGLITNDLAGAPEGQAVYAAMLTPKGRMVADMRALRRDGEVLLDLDAAALEGLTATLKKYIPPLFARFEIPESSAVLGLYGPGSRDIVAALSDAPLPEMAEDASIERGVSGARVIILRTLYTGEDGFDLIVPVPALEPVWAAAVEAGARPLGHATLDVLRIEAGRPRWGAELTAEVIPLEAGLLERAISTGKGCYTGQEVIVRILHRGHVNRLLRGMLLGDAPVPAAGAELVRPEDGRRVGRITSACFSPRSGQTIALGYVRRELEPPARVRLETTEGSDVVVVELPFLAAS